VTVALSGCHGAVPDASAADTAAPGARDNGAVQIALAGNPNVGKSTVFNSLTGLQVGTANYPGTTVDVTVAAARIDGHRLTIIDLPGTYALAGHTADQRAARRALLEDRPDAVIAVLDATNLARNL
jgi:ferrous iron transport protein B